MKRGQPLRRGKPLKTVSPLKRTTGLPRTGSLERRVPLAAVSLMPKEGEVPAALRARPGSMTAAVALVLAGAATVAQASWDFEVDPERLERQAARAFRRAVMERDDWTCRECGAMATEVQHRVARGMGGTADPRIAFGLANGVALCARSHRLAEKRDPGLYDRGFWRWQGEDPAEVPITAAAEWGQERLWLLPDGETSRSDPRRAAA